jgi:signal transduction histidine kinase
MATHPDVTRDATRFLRLVNALDHAIVWEFDDTTQRYMFVSDHSLLVLGYESKAWLADPRSFERCIYPDDLPAFLALLDKLRAGDANDLRLEHRCVNAEGAIMWFHTGVHRADENGLCIFRGVTIDINNVKAAGERERQARVEAEQAARRLEEVLAIVSHDVRTPLNSLLLAVHVLQTGSSDSSSVAIASVSRSATKLTRLIDDLVDLASIREQRLRITPTETTTSALLHEAIEGATDAALEKNVALVWSERSSIDVRCDPKRIAQVLANMVGNAVKFSASGGTVELAASADALEVQFSVRDHGVGITAENLPHVFERHWQAPETAWQGQGLGLFIAKGIVDAHAGRIWVESVPGQETSFYFTLPRTAQD